MSDILFIDDNEGGALQYGAYNDIRTDNTILSMCYISLFNGDTPLNALRDEQFDNSFEIALSKRMITKNRQEAEQIGTTGLQWLKTEKAVKNIEINIVQSDENSEKFDIKVNGSLPDGSTFSELLTTIGG